MNFEQNFNPLESGSDEYKSLDIFPLSEPVVDDITPELQKVSKRLPVGEVPIPKKIGAKFTTEPVITDDVRNSYATVKTDSDYFNNLVSQKRKELTGSDAATGLNDYISKINLSNTPDSKEHTDLVYNMAKDFLSIDSDESVRNSFIKAIYAPKNYSTSKKLTAEYEQSPLNTELSPREYSGLKSLQYGKESDYNQYASALRSPETSDVEKKLIKLSLDKLGANIDIAASSKMVNDSGYEKFTEGGVVRNQEGKEKAKYGIDLYNASVQSLPLIDEMIRDVEFQNPYNPQVLSNLMNNAVKRGYLMAEGADVINAAIDEGGYTVDAEKLAEIQRSMDDAKSSKAFDEFMKNLSFESFSKNPVGILAELTVESFVALYKFGATRAAAGAAVGAPLGPGGAGIGLMAGMGAASLGLEKAGVILEELEARGYNTKSAEDIKKAFSDEKLLNELVKEGYKKGIPVAVFDMLSMGLAGSVIKRPAKTLVGRVAQGLGEVGIQATAGGTGEALGQIVQKGQVRDWAGVVAEAIGEIGTGVPEIAFNTITDKAKNNQPVSKNELVLTVSSMGVDKSVEDIDVMVGSGRIDQQTADALKQRINETAAQLSKLPSSLSSDAKATIVDLIDTRDRALANAEGLDDVFKKEANKIASDINDRIATIAREDITKTQQNATQESIRTKQESLQQGGISEYQRTQTVQEQATTEADVSNRPVGSTEEVAPQFQRASAITVNWEKSPEGKGDPSISARNPIVAEAAKQLKSGNISNEEYRATVSENSPITPITRFFEPATKQEVNNALSSDKVEKVNAPIDDNAIVGLRLDIPAYKNNNTWVVSVHDGPTNKGKAMSYRNVARITDVTFGVEPKAALAIASGVPKTTIGRMFGNWQNIAGDTMEQQGENAKNIVQDVVNSPEWVQVGMNPFRHSYFYDRSSEERGRPIKSAQEVVQIGGLVYAKNPEYGNWTDEAYRVKGMLDSKGVPVQFKKEGPQVIGGFYSNTEKKIAEFNQPKASAQKWKTIVGTKSDEAFYSGLADWLDEKAPNEQVSKEDILRFMNENRIKIDIKEYGVNESEYKEYTIPGGDKYKEILVTLPREELYRAKHFEDNKNIITHLRVNTRKTSNRDNVLFLEELQSDWGQDGKRKGFKREMNDSEIKRLNEIKNSQKEILNGLKSYKLLDSFVGDVLRSNYKPEEGVLEEDPVYILLDSIEARISGIIDNPYYNDNNQKDIKRGKLRIVDDVKNQIDYNNRFADNEYTLSNKQILDIIDAYSEDSKNGRIKKQKGYDSSRKTLKVFNEVDELSKDAFDIFNNATKGIITPAPYVTDTNAWVKLGLKIALKEAIAQGSNVIAWTTGQQQNERYDLRKQVDSIGWERDEDGTYAITAEKDGDEIVSEKGLTNRKLEDVIGKDASQKIINNKNDNGILQGDDLIVGGKGMEAFYGDVKNPGIISNVAKSLVKSLTGKEANIIDVQVLGNEEEDIVKRIFNEKDVNIMANYGFKFFRDGRELTKEAAVESVNSKRPVFARKDATISQPGIEITPELREAVLAGMPQFQTEMKQQETSAQIVDEINRMADAYVDFSISDIGTSVEANVDDLVNRKGIALKPNVIEISDFNGIPVMVTISDELTTGNITNTVTNTVIPNLAGGVGFNYSEGNTGYAWAYTDEATARDTFNTALEVYNKNPELYPDGIIPVAVVKMGTQAMNSNEAVFRVLIQNLATLPANNLTSAYEAYKKDVDSNIKRLEEIKAKGKLTPSSRNELNGYNYIKDVYLKENDNIIDVIRNINSLNINTRPLVINRITAGEIGKIPSENRLRADKPASVELMKGLGKEDIKKIHLGYIAEPLRDNSIKNVPDKHIISFVGIDVNSDGPIKIDTHPNYPYALKGKGLGIVKNTAHIASVMPTAYGNAIKKLSDAAVKGEKITSSQAISRALPSGLSNSIFKGKTLSEKMSNMDKLIGFMNLSFPKVTFFNDAQSFNDIISSPNVRKYVRNGEVIYGLTTNGEVYLNPSIATMNTAIHEMGHIWTDYVENTNNPLFKKGLELVEGTKELEIAISQLGDNPSARKEALAMLIGNRGENITNAAQKSKFKEWLFALWKYLQSKFPELRKLNTSQIGNLSLEEFIGGALRDILSGNLISEDPSSYTYQDVKKMSDLIPIGENLPSGPQGPTPPGEVGPVRDGAGPVQKKKYEWEMGDRAQEMKGEQMIKTSTGRYVATETMRAQIMDSNKVLNEIKKAKEPWLAKIVNDTKVGMLDNQYRVFNLLKAVGKSGQLVASYLRTRNSASATAMMMADDAVKQIYGGLSKKKKYQFGEEEISEYQMFNRVIGFQRVISIQNQMDQTYRDMLSAYKSGNMNEYKKNRQRLLDNGMIDESGNYVGVDENGKFIDPVLETEFALGQVTATQAIRLLDEVRFVIGEEDFDKMMNLSEQYSSYFNNMMKDRMEAGLISMDSYNYLSEFFYAPTRYINNILVDPILSIASPTSSSVKDKTLQIKNLSGGSERLNANDYEGLIRAITYASEYSIAENRTTTRFFDLIQENKENFEKNGIRPGTIYTPIERTQSPIEDAIDKNVKMITEGKKPSMDKALPSGQKMLPYKGVQVAQKMEVGEVRGSKTAEPEVNTEVDENGNMFLISQVPLKVGEDYIKLYKDGRRYDIIVPSWFADAWYNRNMSNSTTATFVGKVTGSNLLRLVATGINPVFGIAQLIPDTISAYVATAKERKYSPLLIDYSKFFMNTLAAAKDIKNNSSDYLEAMKYGATTNFYNGGMVSFERGLLGKEDKSLEKVIEQWNIPGLKQYVMGSKKITETTEQMSKVALYKNIRDSKISDFIKENEVAPIGQDLEDIRIEAAAMSRATADFHRKGTVGSELNKIIPYLNAAIQVQRAVIGSTKENPLKVLAYSMEFASYGVLLMLSALGLGDDDETKEKKRIAWSKFSDFDKDNRVPISFVESKGKFITVKLPQFVTPLWSLIRRSTEKIYQGESFDYSTEQVAADAKAVTMATIEQFPLTQFVNLEKVASRNPLYSGISKMYNRDPYRQEEVVAYEKATKDYLEGAKIGQRRAAEMYQKIGKAAVSPILPEGISPKRLEAAMSTIPFENNPFSGVLIAATEMATSEKQLFEERFGKDAISVILKASGISQRYFKEGTKINQNIVDLPNEEVKSRGETKEKIANILIPKLDEALLTMEPREAFDSIRRSFVNNEYQKLDPESKRIAKSYIENELKSRTKSLASKQDPMVTQIVSMNTSDAKIDAMVNTMFTIKTSDSSRMKFVGDIFDAGVFESSDFARRVSERGLKNLSDGKPNPYYEQKVGALREMALRYKESKSGE